MKSIKEKANAPEKIYIDANEDWHRIHTAYIEKAKDDDIEYIRKDAFIERAAEWLDSFYNEDTNSYLIDEDIESFIDYMEGE